MNIKRLVVFLLTALMSLLCFVGCNTGNDDSKTGVGSSGGSESTEQTGGGSSNDGNSDENSGGNQDDDIYTPWIQ